MGFTKEIYCRILVSPTCATRGWVRGAESLDQSWMQ